MGLQVEHRRSTCSCGTLQGRRGFGVWRPRSSETRWASSSCLTSQMNKVSSTSETGWVSYRFTHTAKVQMLFYVATNVTWRIREQSVKKKPVSWQKRTGSHTLRRVPQTGRKSTRLWTSCWISSWRGWNGVLTSPGSPMGPSELMDPPTQTSQRDLRRANVHVSVNNGYMHVSLILKKKNRKTSRFNGGSIYGIILLFERWNFTLFVSIGPQSTALICIHRHGVLFVSTDIVPFECGHFIWIHIMGLLNNLFIVWVYFFLCLAEMYSHLNVDCDTGSHSLLGV